MKLFLKYLRSKLKVIIMFLFFAGVIICSALLFSIPLIAAAYPLFLCFVAGIIILIVDFFRTKNKHERLSLLKESTDALPVVSENEKDIIEQDYIDILNALRAEMNDRILKEDTRYQDMIEYYTVWVHQIKTPIAAMKLAVENDDSELSRNISVQLFRTQLYVDMVLAFLRLGSEYTDYVFRDCDLDSIIRSSVRKFAPEFIARKLSLNYGPVSATVTTDEKWLSFVIEQILSNALKYTRSGSISINMTGPLTLCISDTGIGIAAEDLPRIFEKGYTGCNGRIDKNASGLGLYLVKRVCGNIGIDISVSSAAGSGTCVSLSFPENKNLYD